MQCVSSSICGLGFRVRLFISPWIMISLVNIVPEWIMNFKVYLHAMRASLLFLSLLLPELAVIVILTILQLRSRCFSLIGSVRSTISACFELVVARVRARRKIILFVVDLCFVQLLTALLIGMWAPVEVRWVF